MNTYLNPDAIQNATIPADKLSDTFTNDLTTSIGAKQDKLVSGTNIKTINGLSLLGSGNMVLREYETKQMYQSGQTCSLNIGTKVMVRSALQGVLIIQLPTNPSIDNYTIECGVTFTTGSTVPTIVFNGNIMW